MDVTVIGDIRVMFDIVHDFASNVGYVRRIHELFFQQQYLYRVFGQIGRMGGICVMKQCV